MSSHRPSHGSRLRLERIEIVGLRLPRPHQRTPRPHQVVIVTGCTVDGRRHRGIGEALGGLDTREIRPACDRLRAELDRSPIALGPVEELPALVEAAVAATLVAGSEGLWRWPLETALLDLVAQAVGLPLGLLVGGTPTEIAVTGPPRPVPRDERDARVLIARELPTRQLLRLRSSGDATVDRTFLAMLGAACRERGLQRTVLLELPDGSDLDTTCGLARALGEDAAAGRLPGQVLLDPPARASAPSDLARLRACARRSPSGRVEVLEPLSVHDRGRSGPDAGAVDLRLEPTAGFLETLRMGQRAGRRPGATLLVTTPGTATDLTGWASVHLAAAMAGPVGLRHGAVHGPTLAGSPRLGAEGSIEVAPALAGLGPSFDAAEAAPLAWSRAVVGAPDVAMAGSQPPNRLALRPYDGIGRGRLASHMLERECLAAGLRTTRFSWQLFVAHDRSSRPPLGFDWTTSIGTAQAGRRIAVSKELTLRLLHGADVPTAGGAAFAREQRREAVAYAERLGGPWVVKPAGGAWGSGVTTDIGSIAELEAALERVAGSRFGSTGYIIERFVGGGDYRISVVGGRAVSVVRRVPGHVVGDGERSIAGLALLKNVERRANPFLRGGPLTFDDTTLRVLAAQGLDPTAVPEPGRRIRLREIGNLTQGGESHEVFDETHPSVLEVAVAAVAAVPGLRQAGVDLIIADHTRPADQQRLAVLELNATAEIAQHHFPMFGPQRNVARHIVRHHARSAGLDVTPPRPELAVRLEVVGHVQQVGFRRWLAREARRLEIVGRVGNDPGGGGVQAVLQGRTTAVAALATRCIGGPRPARPVRVTVEPIPPASYDGFRIERGSA
jgi:D-alanine-D-alanine ligase-like ATP-grasp enzyme/acylphosphatase